MASRELSDRIREAEKEQRDRCKALDASRELAAEEEDRVSNDLLTHMGKLLRVELARAVQAESAAAKGWAQADKYQDRAHEAEAKNIVLRELAGDLLFTAPGTAEYVRCRMALSVALNHSSEAGASAPKQRKGNTARTTEACNPSVDAGSRAPVTSTPSGPCRADQAYADNARLRLILCRASVVLANMAREKPGALFGRRWAISAEPLRRDAANVLPDIEAALGLPLGAEAPRGDDHFVQGLKRWLDRDGPLACATCRGSGKDITGEMLLSMPPKHRTVPCPACTKTGGA